MAMTISLMRTKDMKNDGYLNNLSCWASPNRPSKWSIIQS